ncbi:MAG TPA: hypothetical protein VFU31_18190 [Candidatus Binatia bacterium]|nr:hypothetical protein [Candidatus Binatia bacterium]
MDRLKLRLVLAALVFLVGCAGASGQSGNFNRNVYECEREAALAGAGAKAKVFDNCMKSKQRK